MARDPGSKWWPLPEAGEPDGYRKTQLIFHSTGDNASADRIRAYFAQTGVVVESTFIVGVTPDDPTLQIMDSTDNADANYTANQRAISVEVVNDGTSPWTEWQARECIRIGLWALANHPIEHRVCPAHDASGIGWHVMFGAPGPWTTVVGKVCPGAPAINQLKTIIIPAILAGTPQEDDLTPEQDRMLRTVFDTLTGGKAGVKYAGDVWAKVSSAARDAASAVALAKAAAEENLTQEQIDAIVEGVAEKIGDGFDVTLQPKA